VTIVYVPLQLLSLAWASSAFLGAASSEDGRIRDDCVRPPTVAQSRLGLVRCLKCGGAGLRRTPYCTTTARQGAGRVANVRTYPYLRGDLGQAARGGLGGGGRLGGSKGRLSGGAEACLASLASPRGR
jgi:hypothetical protein